MLDPVGSTSWHNRHLRSFEVLAGLLQQEGPADLTVMIVGPGAVTRAAAVLLNDASDTRSRPVRSLIGDAARYADQLLRRIPGLPLRTLEPVELESVLPAIHRLVVVDRSRRVLDAVARDLPHAECHCLDITLQPLPGPAHVVVAFNVVCRLEDPAAGMARIADAVQPGGWLLIDDRSAAAHLSAFPAFRSVAPKIRQREGGTAPVTRNVEQYSGQ